MDWADELAVSVSGPQVVNDSKTPSGTVHVGSLRGPVILDVIVRALRSNGLEAQFLYGVDDLDPMDAQALLTPDAVEHEMGRPLAHVPDQAGDGHPSYARHHAQLFIDTFAGLGIRPDRYYWMSEVYESGAVDPFIRLALDRADRVRDIYRRVANVQHPVDWHPLQVVCETCGKVGTTIVTKWDGERVYYECRQNLVTWAHGCGASGWISPFGGRAKLAWNLEWAAQWSIFGVTIEPCGKDLATAGGSRERADTIAREVFEREPPLNVPYEFLNIGGRKMSTSKGRGAAAHRIVGGRPAGAAPAPVPPAAPEQCDRVRSGGHRRDPAPLRRVRPAGGGDRGTRGQGQPARVAGVGVPLLAAVRGRRRPGRGRGLPTAVQPRGHAPPDQAGRAPSCSSRRRAVR